MPFDAPAILTETCRIPAGLRAAVRHQARIIATAATHGHASLIMPLPLAPSNAPVFTHGPLAAPCFRFARRARDELTAGYGHAAQWRANGPSRLGTLRTAAGRLCRDWRLYDPAATGLGAPLLLGFGFAPTPVATGQAQTGHWPDALLWLPELALIGHAGAAALVLSTQLPADPIQLTARWDGLLAALAEGLDAPPPRPTPRDDPTPGASVPDHAGWLRLIEQALAAIDAGTFEKVVVSRRQRLQANRDFDLARLDAALAALFPACQSLAIRLDTTTLVAATPERLLCCGAGRVEVDALAGTCPRAADPTADAALGAALLASAKNRHEQRLVAEAIVAALRPCCQRVHVSEPPDLMPLRNVQHLWSRVSGTLEPGEDLFTLAERLHPTPATNGQPAAAAGDWLRRHEPHPRGWYTGAAGVLMATPNAAGATMAGDLSTALAGELWVLLRCAAIQGASAELYAGAGIVAGSNPAGEWDETRDKLAAMRSALHLA